MDFSTIKKAVSAQFTRMEPYTLFISSATKDEMWDTYLGSFRPEDNPILRERTEHDCNCCKSFIRSVGNVLAIIDGELVSIWDVEGLPEGYQIVADAMSKLVKSKGIETIFLHSEKEVGTDRNFEFNNPEIEWTHFHQVLPKKVVSNDVGALMGKAKTNFAVLKRSLTEISSSSIEIVRELIAQNSLYRGEEHLATINALDKHKTFFDNAENPEFYCWEASVELGRASAFRNTVIGTLLVDLSEGVELESAVKKFEVKVAPANYKRPKALITQSMIKNAEKTIAELNCAESLPRRMAVTEDITINNVLFADRSVQPEMGVLGVLNSEVKTNLPKLDKVEEVSIETFINEILPKVDTVELAMANNQVGNLMTLIAPVNPVAQSILKWNNNFSWSYNGEVADSMREAVVAAGGRVDGVFRFTHSWNHDGQNQSLMDLHVFLPTHNGHKEGIHDRYGDSNRVGWNNRNHAGTKGVQDVDFVNPPGKAVPLENITFPDINCMPEGTYVCKIHNWDSRKAPKSGFKAEIEVNGELHQFEYPQAVKHKEWITVAEVVLKDGVFTVHPKLESSVTPMEVWGITTQQFRKVNMIMNSPNHWDGEQTGNKHWFFIMDGCVNPDPVRGFYNEFLHDDLHEHRKVFEVLGSKMKPEQSDTQLSGLGFSSTQRNEILCKVTGSFNRIIKIKF